MFTKYFRRGNRTKLVFGFLLAALSVAFLASAASAHGYVESPKSRSYQCRQTGGCGSVQYEPQSVEGPDRFPETGPADGQIASGGRRFGELDAQSENRWPRQPMASGQNTFTWHLTAPHRTADWRYFITKPGWDPNAPIARSAFDLQPFCTDGNSNPGTKESHSCNVPERSGYHLILAVWDVGDTANSFYQVIDAQFDGSNAPITTQTPTTKPPATQPAPTQAPATTPAPAPTPAPAATQPLSNSQSGVAPPTVDAAQGNVNSAGGQLQSAVSLPPVESLEGSAASEGVAPAGAVAYDHTFPNNLVAYRAGTKVMQPKDGKVYQCKPFPDGGFCVQWASAVTQLEPGVGHHWGLAWEEVTQ